MPAPGSVGLIADKTKTKRAKSKQKDERRAAGRAEREQVPLDAHAEVVDVRRRDPVAILEKQNRARVPELVPIRHGRMVVSPFTFYRGGAAVMAADLSRTPTTRLRVQCCGDAHLLNFGVFAAPDRALVFDLNDFDETLPAPFEWDVKRLAASVVIAARDKKLSAKRQREAAQASVRAYRTAIAELATERFLDVWYQRLEVGNLMMEAGPELTTSERNQLAKTLAKARGRTSLTSLGKLAERSNGGFRIREDPPLVVKPAAGAEQLEAIVLQGIADYRRSLSPDRRLVLDRYRYQDFARKVVGVGSVGTEALIVLLMGDRDDDPLFLQVKQAQESVLAPYAGASRYRHQGARVVQGQRLMQGASDSFLGWITGTGRAAREFYVRQLRDMKGSADMERMSEPMLVRYAGLCGGALARAHARAGDAGRIAGYLGKRDTFDRAVTEFAVSYADLNQTDHKAFRRAIKDGRIEARLGL